MEGLTYAFKLARSPELFQGNLRYRSDAGRGGGQPFETPEVPMSESDPNKKWSAEVTAHSDALDLEPNVFTKESPARNRRIAQAIRRVRATAASRAHTGRPCRC